MASSDQGRLVIPVGVFRNVLGEPRNVETGYTIPGIHEMSTLDGGRSVTTKWYLYHLATYHGRAASS